MARAWERFDTIADLDKKAATLPKARNWLNYPYFMFSRYPHLRPSKDDKVFLRTLRRWEERIASHAEARHVLEDLGPAHSEQLAALLVDVIADLEMSRNKISRPRKTFIKAAESRARMLKRKRRKARRALEDLQKYARTRDPLLESEDEEAAKDCVKILDRLRECDFASRLNTVTSLHPVPEDLIASSMVRLYWFFRNACKLAGDEAEIRVALLRNSFWPKYGVATVEIIPFYRTAGESKGCSAVHQAVLRSLPPQITSE